jgi:hypothetical protein
MFSGDNTEINDLPLLTINGLVSVQFLDGNVLEGNFAAQDIFNVFLKIEGEPVMIPRSQIRFIRGRQGQAIEIDTSHPWFKPVSQSQEAVPVTAEVEAIEEFELDDEDTLVPVSNEFQVDEAEADFEEDEEGTVILDSSQGLQFDEAEADFEEDEDSTVIIPAADEEERDDKEDSGTIILSSTIDETDETDTTMVVDIDALPSLFDDEDDATMVLGHETKASEVSATLICISGPHTGDVVKLKSGITTIGRSSDNIIMLSKDKEISRHHALIIQESGRFVVQDQNSLNGTFVNDEQVTSPRYLEDGDVILVGVSTFRYEEE